MNRKTCLLIFSALFSLKSIAQEQKVFVTNPSTSPVPVNIVKSAGPLDVNLKNTAPLEVKVTNPTSEGKTWETIVVFNYKEIPAHAVITYVWGRNVKFQFKRTDQPKQTLDVPVPSSTFCQIYTGTDGVTVTGDSDGSGLVISYYRL